MVNRIGPNAVGTVGAIARSGGSSGSRTGRTLRNLAGNVAGRMARELRLLGDERRQGGGGGDGFRDGEDIYEIRGAARQLSQELNGKPTDEGRLARSLNLFVQESASLLAARPDAASLETIARVIAAREQAGAPETLDRALGQIDQTTRDLSEDALR